ncbi:cryptochrome/photolyase family protein [Luminiphilus sp.]|nr:cryptochrome/photolyase family protein [Luminiphilus sp.]
MNDSKLILVLGDQLSPRQPALRQARPGIDVILLAEVWEEASYVRHNRHKITLLFSAMRHFRDELESAGHRVHYITIDQRVPSLEMAVRVVLDSCDVSELLVCEPGEYRLLDELRGWQDALNLPVSVLEDDRFLASHADFAALADGKKQLRMEFFYRKMRARYQLLMEGSGPAGGKWNYDADNRAGWRNQRDIPDRVDAPIDAITREVIDTVNTHFPENPGDLSHFRLAVTREEVRRQFDWFLEHALADFGRYQDALVEESPWVFHGLISMYINCGLLEPLEVCERVEKAWQQGACPLSTAEGFIRQILGWREYIRGIYWLLMPEYKNRNALSANRPLPNYFWTANTEMRCLSRAIEQSLDHGYAHHIQRLMVIGNFALLTGLDVAEVCDWYLGVYVDAYEWVELPNTLGMALYADNAVIASKPYAASGKYIQKQGNHCQQCQYKPTKVTGPDACPFNSLYWRFIDQHLDRFGGNPRMGLVVANWRKRDPEERAVIVQWADQMIDQWT